MAHKKGVGSSRNGRDSNPQMLGVSLPAVKSRVHRSRLFVRKKLAEYLADA